MNDELKIKNNELGGKMNYRYRNDEEMKESGIKWSGRIPNHWINNKLSREFKIIGSGTTPLSSNLKYYDGNINWLLTGDLNDGYIYETSRKISKMALNDYSSLCVYPENSLVIAMYGATIGKTGLTKIKTTTNQACCVLSQPISSNVKFIYYWFLANKNEIVNLGRGGGQPNISQDLIKSLKISRPLKMEQDKIVKFLDEKVAEFDSIISKKEALIEKLEEAKKSLISEVVTGKVKVVKSSDDGYELVERKKEEMKDCGVEWLGLVPTEWKIYRSKYLWKKEKREVKEDYGVVTAFRDGEVTLRENRRTEGFTFAIKEIGYQGVLKGDLVISAMDAFAGAMGISDSEGKCSPVYSVCSPVKELEPQYYNYLLKEMSQKGYILSLAKGIRERSTDFRYSEFANTFLLYPNIEEQKIIANYLFDKVIFINNFIITINNQIEKLKEAKQSLISEAVTGKIEILD